MKQNAIQIGFSQRIQLPWLEYTAELVRNGKSRDELNSALQELLYDKLSVGHQVKRGNREKAITILMKIWHGPRPELVNLRDEGLELLDRLPFDQHVAIHWGMSMAVYPFFGTVAATVGKLLRLQNDVSTAQVQRRIREQLGERETVARAARRIYRSFIDWGVLTETDKKGTYVKAMQSQLPDSALCGWLVETILRANGGGWTPVSAVVGHASLFPFSLSTAIDGQLVDRGGLESMQHGLDQEMVRVRAGTGTHRGGD